jgi:hypothetical protein
MPVPVFRNNAESKIVSSETAKNQGIKSGGLSEAREKGAKVPAVSKKSK